MRKIKRLTALLLCFIMVASMAPMGIFASAADSWVYAAGASYEPVTVYERQSSMTNGNTYLVDIDNQHYFAEYRPASDDYQFILAPVIVKGMDEFDDYAADENGSSMLNDFIVDETGDTYKYAELKWSDDTLFNPASQKYMVPSGGSGSYNVIFSSSADKLWNYSSNRLYYKSTYSYYLNYSYDSSNGNRYALKRNTTGNATVYPYIKKTAYRKTETLGGYYMYNGETDFYVDKGASFNVNTVLNAVSVLYKPSQNASPVTYSISSPGISFRWNRAVDTSKEGNYSAVVYANGVELETITVHVGAGAQSFQQKDADPSTSDLRGQFRGYASDDGKVLTDKTVRDGMDEFNVFSDYEEDEFSVALSTLGQSYKMTETVETIVEEKLHPDVVFVIDASGSMRTYNVAGEEMCRGEATAVALNNAIKELYDADPETRIGIVTYNNDLFEGVYLPLDKYTLPEGQTDYITWNGRNVASVTSRTGSQYKTYDVKTVSESNTSDTIKTSSNPPGGYSSGDEFIYYKPSSLTEIATVNGVTYSAAKYRSGGTYLNPTYTIYLYKTGHDKPVARMQNNPESNYYTKVYADDNITITASNTTVTYTTNTYTSKKGTPSFTFEENEYMMATNFLINSKGEVVRPSCYTFIGNLGTYTQAGLQEAENMYAAVGDKDGRFPAVVLISDGIPTIGNANTDNPTTYYKDGVTTGHGLTQDPQTSEGLSTIGLYLVKTAMKVKKNLTNMYDNDRNALFYTIGPGVDYIMGQTILDPCEENVAKAAKSTRAGDEESESGVAIPSDLAKKLQTIREDPDYSDYADWSWSGDMNSEELNEAFRRVAQAITGVTRPVAITTKHDVEGDAFAENAAMIFTDNIGEGMELRGTPIVVYNKTNYKPTTSSAVMHTDGSNGVVYGYNYTVTEPSTNKSYSLNGLTIEVKYNTDGTQTVKWYIPADLVPVIVHDLDNDTFSFAEPIRLVYKVGVVDDSKAGTYYTNSTDDIATAEFTPTIGNPYYYNNVKDPSDGQMHSYLKSDISTNTNKTQNITDTDPDSTDVEFDNNGNATVELGNNGIIAVKGNDIKLSYDLYLVDENGNPVDENGNPVSFDNRVVMSDLETITQSVGSDVEIGYDELEKLLPEGYRIYSPDATFTQTYTSTGTGGITDKISDTTSTTKVYDPSGTSVSSNGTVTGITDYSDIKVTFAIAKIPDDIKVSYNLYLVDSDGNPIDTNGNTVSFDNRTVMSDLETITQSVGSDVEIGYDELLEILPEGYYIYNPDATFTQNYTSTGTGGVTDKISDTTSTTKVFYPNGTSVSSDGTVTGITDYSDVKVTFAIAKVTILPDVIVADYGKPILCSPLDNDEGAKSIIGISAMDSAKPVSEVKTQNGIFKVEGKNVVFYPFSYMSSINKIKYYADVVDSANNSQQLSSTVSVIPATTVYYEDNFGGSAVNGGLYIKYSGDWFTVTDSGSKSGNLTAKVNSAEKQDRGEVGMGHIPYGFDSSYNGDTKFSDGTAAMVEGSISGTGTSKTYNATASFTFTGTGFDIISRTDLDCGLINVMIYDHDSGELIDSVPVINKGVENLYQIPVISYTGIPYDTYDVVINVSSPIAYLGITGSTFYLDAIRIYDPMGKKSSDNPEFDEANEAYNTDKEANAFIASIRDFIIQVDSLGVEESYGAVYVDTINNDYNAGGVIGNVKAPEFTDEQKRHRSMSEEDLNTFELVGPNEEVYLTPGYGIGFIVETNILPESVQLEIKMPTPAKTASQSVLSVQTYGKSGSQKNFSVKSATEMFYDITSAVQFTKTNGVYRATVILSNGLPSSANENEIVSVTNIKMTYPKNANASNNFGLDAAENGTVNLEQGTPEYAENAEMIALADCGAANVSLKASKELYKQVFDTVYVQRVASTPNYDVVNAEISDSVVSGEYVDVTFNTAAFVDNVVLVDENGNEIALTDINCTTDESKRFTDDYLNTKTWTAKARLIADEGEHEYIVKSADETGETEVLTVDVKPAELKKLSVKTAPEKTVYAYGETIDTTGLKLEAEYTDDTEKTITDGVTFSNTTANRSGRMNITASVDGKTAEFTVDVVSLVSANDRTVVDLENKLVYGIEVNSPEILEYVESIDEKATVSCTDAIVGTGSEINLLYGDEVIDTYSAVIFGDVNGDGWYDGTDSIIVNCLAMGLLSRAQVGEAVYMAADCNHDGEVDEIDVAILEEAGMLASSIDQTKSTEELVEVCSAFEDYVNLISQSVEPETVITEEETPAPEKTEETTTQAETTETQPEQQTEQSIFDTIVSLIKQLVSFISSMLAMFKSIF